MTIVFEQPLNEHTRLCLKLEHLFKIVQQNINQSDEFNTRLVLDTLNNILNVIDRPDIKTKLTKALSQHAATLTQLENSPHVDPLVLRNLLDDLDRLIDSLYALHAKIAQPLRDNEFLTALRQQQHSPGGSCDFNVPSYQLFLQKPASERQEILTSWFHNFDLLREVVTILLQLIRQSVRTIPGTAFDGFFQKSLDPNAPCDLIRVNVPSNKNVFPEISVGRHRLSVRFWVANVITRSQQAHENIEFELGLCGM